jgi:hypothetical protein
MVYRADSKQELLYKKLCELCDSQGYTTARQVLDELKGPIKFHPSEISAVMEKTDEFYRVKRVIRRRYNLELLPNN